MKYKSWCKEIEENALKQIENITSLPFVYPYVAIMPDCHTGYGVPIGCVLPTKNVVIPNAVGVDIGCGMIACKLNIDCDKITPMLSSIVGEIKRNIPVGFNRRSESELPETLENYLKESKILSNEIITAKTSMATLGGGNHFIEIQKDIFGYVWIMIHSGSRNLGKTVANKYNELAININKKYFSSVPLDFELAFLHKDDCKDYLFDMGVCKIFASFNRNSMMNIIIDILSKKIPELKIDEQIDTPHNYVELENHKGENVYVHRKGAIRVREGDLGIIPGSQGTSSYIVRGKGNEDSLMSCSHGAGRKMSRTKAENTLNLNEQIKLLNDKGVLHNIKNKEDLDEAPGAYKDIDEVIESQKDLIEVIYKLNPIAVIKG